MIVGGWERLSWVQLTQVPRAADATDALGLRRQIFAALAGAHAELLGLEAESSSIAFVCMRPRGSRRLLYAMGGHPVFPFVVDDAEGDAGDVPVLYPPGSRGCSIPAAQVEAELEKLPYWVRCVGEADILWAPEAAESRGLPSLRLPFDEYVAHLTDPFCWMVIAEPVPRDVVEAERSRLAGRIPLLRQRENSQVHRIELERTEARFRELTRSRATGLWSVRIAVGGVHPARTRRTAVLLSSASDLDDVPYVVLPGATLGSLAEVLSGREEIDGGRSPFLATSEFLGSVARPPRRELPGVRTVLPAAFDVTPEQFSADPAGILMGTVLDDALRPAGELQVSYQTLNRHTFVCGATGSGKSQTARWLLESLSTGPRRIPWLVVEPAKAEYSRMAARLGPEGRVLVIRPGELDSPPASLNPLEPEPGFPLQSHADLVRALFLAAFEANEPFPQVLSQALARCYTQAGWDLVTGRQRPATKPLFHRDDPLEPVRPRYPLLGELQSAARVVVDEIGYGRFVDVRIGSLRTGAPGRFFEGGHPLDVGELLSLNAVLELEPITNDQDKAFLMGAVLIRIVEHLRVRHGAAEAGELRHVLLLEEAHRLLRKVESGPAAAAVELFASLLAEIRAYGEGVVVIEQIPAKIVPDVIKNTALKVMHRLPALDDREAVGATMNLTAEQSEAVVALPPGVAALTVDGADRPLLVRMKSGVGRELGGQCNRVPPMARRRSTLCGKECLAEACNLRELNESRSIHGARHRTSRPPSPGTPDPGRDGTGARLCSGYRHGSCGGCSTSWSSPLGRHRRLLGPRERRPAKSVGR